MTKQRIERVDSLPLILYWLTKMCLQEAIDAIWHPHPYWHCVLQAKCRWKWGWRCLWWSWGENEMNPFPARKQVHGNQPLNSCILRHLPIAEVGLAKMSASRLRAMGDEAIVQSIRQFDS